MPEVASIDWARTADQMNGHLQNAEELFQELSV